jgi:hypothetical protein
MNEQTINPNVVKALSHFTGNDGSRPTLGKVHIQDGAAVAADGFILATAPTQTNGFNGNVDATELLNTAKLVKRCDALYLMTDRDDPRTVAVSTDPRRGGMSYGPLTVTNEAYPDWRQIIPRADETDIQVQISPKLLEQLVKAAKAIDGQVVHLRIRQEPDAKPIQFAITGSETVTGVLMPMMSTPHDFS